MKPLKKYKVKMFIEPLELEILAINEEEAEEAAWDQFDPNDCVSSFAEVSEINDEENSK